MRYSFTKTVINLVGLCALFSCARCTPTNFTSDLVKRARVDVPDPTTYDYKYTFLNEQPRDMGQLYHMHRMGLEVNVFGVDESMGKITVHAANNLYDRTEPKLKLRELILGTGIHAEGQKHKADKVLSDHKHSYL